MKMVVHPEQDSQQQQQQQQQQTTTVTMDTATTPVEVIVDQGLQQQQQSPSSIAKDTKDEPYSDTATRLLPEEGLALSWSDIKYSVPVGKKQPEKQLLKGMDGIARPGEVLAIMGGSGAGKTTLLNVLAGRIGMGTLTGEVLVNGQQRKKTTWRKSKSIEMFHRNCRSNSLPLQTFIYNLLSWHIPFSRWIC
jgi:ABC-type glutathione transport system ATPase component